MALEQNSISSPFNFRFLPFSKLSLVFFVCVLFFRGSVMGLGPEPNTFSPIELHSQLTSVFYVPFHVMYSLKELERYSHLRVTNS